MLIGPMFFSSTEKVEPGERSVRGRSAEEAYAAGGTKGMMGLDPATYLLWCRHPDLPASR